MSMQTDHLCLLSALRRGERSQLLVAKSVNSHHPGTQARCQTSKTLANHKTQARCQTSETLANHKNMVNLRMPIQDARQPKRGLSRQSNRLSFDSLSTVDAVRCKCVIFAMHIALPFFLSGRRVEEWKGIVVYIVQFLYSLLWDAVRETVEILYTDAQSCRNCMT